MEYTDDGIVLSARPHGETHAIADILTASHGRWSGLVYGGQGRRMQPLLQAGNQLCVHWKGRDAQSLGHFSLELVKARSGQLMQNHGSLVALGGCCALLRACLSERENVGSIYTTFEILLDALGDEELWPPLMARWELGVLAELGFGLQLEHCAATGGNDSLVYISPKSARAVSASAGEPYKDKLLPLPAYWIEEGAPATRQDAIDGLKTTGYFLESRVLHPTGNPLPTAREKVIAYLQERL